MKDETADFRNLDPITDTQVEGLLEAIAKKTLRYLKKKNIIDDSECLVPNPNVDQLFQEHEVLTDMAQMSIQGKIAFGPNAGNYVTKIGSGFCYSEEVPLAKGKLCFSMNGFSLHAATKFNPLDRRGLYKHIEYLARGPFNDSRVELTESNMVKLKLKTPWTNGTTHLLFTKLEFLERLASLVPPPKSHLVRWSGCFAPNSNIRQKIVLRPQVKKGFYFDEEDKQIKNLTVSKLLAKTFGVDVLHCDGCGGKLRLVAAVQDPRSIKRYLEHIGEDSKPPARAPPLFRQQAIDFDQTYF
jgi:hypothetical protein